MVTDIAWRDFCENIVYRIRLDAAADHPDLDHSVSVSLSKELFLYWFMYFLSYVGSRDLVRQWPAVHNPNKQRFLDMRLLKRGEMWQT